MIHEQFPAAVLFRVHLAAACHELEAGGHGPSGLRRLPILGVRPLHGISSVAICQAIINVDLLWLVELSNSQVAQADALDAHHRCGMDASESSLGEVGTVITEEGACLLRDVPEAVEGRVLVEGVHGFSERMQACEVV